MCHLSTGIRGLASISFQCFISFGPLLLPTTTRPISSFDPMWSWSITEMESAVRRMRSQATLNTNDSLKLGSVVLCLVCVFCFSSFLPSYSSQTFTYGSEIHHKQIHYTLSSQFDVSKSEVCKRHQYHIKMPFKF